jgi:hypothetical protein
MSEIYIVNVAVGGYYTEQHSYYHRTESEAVGSFEDCILSAGEDRTLIELIRLNTETLDATTIRGWEGTCEDLEDEEAELEAEGKADIPEDEDDGICEGSP